MKPKHLEYLKLFSLTCGTVLLLAATAYIALVDDTKKEQAQAHLGDPDAQYAYARTLASSGTMKDMEEAVAWLKKSAERKNVTAAMTLARLYFTGDGVALDAEQGAEWLKHAAANGSSFAQAMMGMLYMGGIGVKQDAELAAQYLEQSREPEAEMMLKDLTRNIARINGLPPDQREGALETFYARKKLYTGELFGRLLKKMRQQEQITGEESDGN